MKYFAIIVAATLALTACHNSKEGGNVTEGVPTTSDSLKVALANQDTLLSLMNEVAEGMTAIKQMENILSTTNDLTAESTDRRQQIKNDMLVIQQALQQRRDKLDELEKKLKNSNANNSTLQKSIATLKSQIAEQESTIDGLRNDLEKANIHIEKLTANVDSLSNTVATVTAAKEVVEKEATDLTNELNTCYYALGSKQELKNHNLIETGFLRKTKIMPEDYEQSYFTKADKRTLASLDLHSKKAKVLTNQPADSYTITETATGSKVLNITNPARFWNTSNFLIVQID